MAKNDALPDIVYVTRESDGDGGYFLTANETLEHAEHGELVGIYELAATKTMRVARELK